MPRPRQARVCTCTQYIATGETARNTTGKEIPGRLVGYNKFQIHRQQERACVAMASAIGSVEIDVVQIASLQPSANIQDASDALAQVMGQDVLRTSSLLGPKYELVSSDRASQTAEITLSHILIELNSKSRNVRIMSSPLVFESPPKYFSKELHPAQDIDLVLNGGALPLQLHAVENLTFLEHQTWILQAYSDVDALSIDSLDKRGFEHQNEVMDLTLFNAL
jgi:hypothetical protein